MVVCQMRVIIVALTLASVGCAYRLPAPLAMRPQQLRLVTTLPQDYALHVEGTRPRDYSIPPDGRVTFDTPSGLPRACSVYFLDLIKISDGADPSKSKVIDVVAGAKTLRKLSMRDLFSLPSDADGYHLLTVDR
jgi:hypothetical protein